MVLKKGKYGVRTGGTIRSHPNAIKRYDERSSDATAKVTVFRPDGEEKSSLNLPEHFESGVQYSLNKRDRWHLPAKVYEEVHAMAIQDYHAASDDDSRNKKRSGKQQHHRRSVVLVQHPGMDQFNQASADSTSSSKSNFVMYYGDRYTIPVERASRKSKLDAMNVVAQLDEGSFFGGRHERSGRQSDHTSSVVSDDEESSTSQEHQKERSRRVIRSVQDVGTSKRLVQQSGPRSAPEESPVEAEHIHVFLADKKYINKRQVLKQPKKAVEQQLPATNASHHQALFMRKSSFDSDYVDDDYSDEESSAYASDHEYDHEQTSAVPSVPTFSLSNFLVTAH